MPKPNFSQELHDKIIAAALNFEDPFTTWEVCVELSFETGQIRRVREHLLMLVKSGDLRTTTIVRGGVRTEAFMWKND